MPLESEDRIVTRHSFAVIGHLQESPAAGLDIDDNARCAGIDGIFDQFFSD